MYIHGTTKKKIKHRVHYTLCIIMLRFLVWALYYGLGAFTWITGIYLPCGMVVKCASLCTVVHITYINMDSLQYLVDARCDIRIRRKGIYRMLTINFVCVCIYVYSRVCAIRYVVMSLVHLTSRNHVMRRVG